MAAAAEIKTSTRLATAVKLAAAWPGWVIIIAPALS
jgi:hypothetical protein